MVLADHKQILNRGFNKNDNTHRVEIIKGGGSSTSNQSISEAGENISAIKVIRAAVSNTVVIAEPDNFVNSNAIGITITAANSGNPIKYITTGELYDSSLSFTEGDPLYLGSNGTITDIAPTTGFLLLLGSAITGGININIQQPIQL
jgi:hypothetical protein